MKYREVPTTCKCGKPRRKGQRDCRECHAEAGRNARRESGELSPAETVKRAMVRVARPAGRKKLPPEFEAKLRGLAQRVVREIEQFNATAGAA